MFPSNCYLTLMVDCSSLMANCKTCWVPNSSWMVNYTTGLGKNSLTVNYSFSMVNYKSDLVRNFWMVRMGQV